MEGDDAMSAVLALERARAVGVTLAVDGDHLLLEALAKPPDEVLDLIWRHKPQIVALLRPATVTDIPEHVAAGLLRLAKAQPLWDQSRDQWIGIIKTVKRLAAMWDAQARRLGWRELDLYGLHPRAPRTRYDCRGLFWSVHATDRIAALDASAAAIEKPSGNVVRYYRLNHDTDAVLAWNITNGERS
jgi:hypothetical protein